MWDDIFDEILQPNAATVQPDESGALRVMAVGPRARSSAEITARAKAIEADPLRSFIPFESPDGSISWAQTPQEFETLGITADALELAFLEESETRAEKKS